VVATLSVLVVALSTAVIVRIVRPPSPKTQQGADGKGLAGGLRDLADRYPSVPDTSAPSPTLPGAPPAAMTAPGTSAGGVAAIKRRRRGATTRHRNPDLGAYQDQVLISAWRSPTDFLLRSAAGDWLRTIPDIRDSLVKIDGR